MVLDLSVPVCALLGGAAIVWAMMALCDGVCRVRSLFDHRRGLARPADERNKFGMLP